jgi:hypothetical protein
MVQGMFHRAAVAIVLMATLLLPYGKCQSPSRGTAHDCCRHSAPPPSVKASCCTVRSEVPAIVVERAVANPTAADLQPEFTPAPGRLALFDSATAPALPQHSPPPGKSILRI